LEELASMLALEDFGALELFAESRQALASAPPALIQSLEDALQQLDMAAAQGACKALLTHYQS
jgi:hypothetical protein